jgi:hypothetical protein
MKKPAVVAGNVKSRARGVPDAVNGHAPDRGPLLHYRMTPPPA